jgi:formylglycine-generating enzyme required for sulfatase activity
MEFLRVAKIDVRLPHSSCPDGMALIDRDGLYFCIDRFEWPNQFGVLPPGALTAYEAEGLCQSVRKRLCDIEEWQDACFGGDYHNLYSYGPTHQDYCNDHATGYIQPRWGLMYPLWSWKLYARTLYRGFPEGSAPFCYNRDFLYEMIGNMREWVKNPAGIGGYGIAGGYWFGTMQGPPTCLSNITNHSPGFASYEFSVRCCANPW